MGGKNLNRLIIVLFLAILGFGRSAFSANSRLNIDAIAGGYEALPADLEQLTPFDLLQLFGGSLKLDRTLAVQMIKALEYKLPQIVRAPYSESLGLGGLFQRYQKALDKLGNCSECSHIDVVKALVSLENAQDFWNQRLLKYYLEGFSPSHISDAINKIMTEMKLSEPKEAIHLLESLAQSPIKMSPERHSKTIFMFALKHGLIVDATTLFSFVENYLDRLFGSENQIEHRIYFLRSDVPSTLALIGSASPKQAARIISSLYGIHQGIAFEEWVRNYSIAGSRAAEVIHVLESAVEFARLWAQPEFSYDDWDRASVINHRIHTASSRLAADFAKLGPTKEEKKKFIELANFFWGEYGLRRLFRKNLGPRTYEVASLGTKTKAVSSSSCAAATQ